ncbi:hypothetical protein OH687_11210 [Burkholderia anthina]|nr:hypothetical protein OH687_11210 [Burkholderia anthina]
MVIRSAFCFPAATRDEGDARLSDDGAMTLAARPARCHANP